MNDDYERKQDRQFKLILAILAAIAAVAIYGVMTCKPVRADDCYPSLHSARVAHPRGHIGWTDGCFYPGYHHHHHERGVPASRRHDPASRAVAAAPDTARHQVPPSGDGLPAAHDPPRAVSDPLVPKPVRSFRVVHVPEFDTGPPDTSDATFDQRFGPAYAMVERPGARAAFEHAAAVARLNRQLEDQRRALAELRALVEQMEAQR